MSVFTLMPMSVNYPTPVSEPSFVSCMSDKYESADDLQSLLLTTHVRYVCPCGNKLQLSCRWDDKDIPDPLSTSGNMPNDATVNIHNSR